MATSQPLKRLSWTNTKFGRVLSFQNAEAGNCCLINKFLTRGPLTGFFALSNTFQGKSNLAELHLRMTTMKCRTFWRTIQLSSVSIPNLCEAFPKYQQVTQIITEYDLAIFPPVPLCSNKHSKSAFLVDVT